jgi:hypothetical protein
VPLRPTVSRVPPEAPRPGPLPDPPADLASRLLPIIPTDQSWYRIHSAHHGPLYFGRMSDPGRTEAFRFDAPASEYGVLYVAATADGAFAETLARDPAVSTLSRSLLRTRCLSVIRARRTLYLVNVRGRAMRRIGADARLWAGEYAVAQRWSLALQQHPARVDGLYYCSRHEETQHCAAIFDRAAEALEVGRTVNLADADQATLLARLLDECGIELLENED